MKTMTRRQLLASVLPASLAGVQPAQAAERWPGPGGDNATAEERVRFVYDITQNHTRRINGLEKRVGSLEKLAVEALKYFGFGNPVRQSDRGET